MIGKTISHYKILEKLGEGGMGVVYKAEDTKLKRTVALKFLPPELVQSEEWKERFLREAQAAAALAHPSICHTYEIDEADNQTFIAMEYIEGTSLTDRLKSGRLSIDDTLDIALRVAEGLKHAHKRGIVHRDIKPANIMIAEDSQAKIMDFGLAKLAGRTRLTKASTIMGTVAYMSPEQARGDTAVDHRTDIWSLGVLLYEMLTGKLPFDAETDTGVIYKIIHEDPVPVTTLRNEVPATLERTIRKSMGKDIHARYEDISELINDLEAVKSGERISAQQRSPSIAVLPFVNMSADPEQEYFCDGLSEELINALTQIQDLKVIARTSAFSFRGKEVDVRDIGKKLDVGNVLEGSVRKAGNKLRITAQLVNSESGHHLWSERYDKELDDVFSIQDEITLAIVEKLKPKLLGRQKLKLARRQTVDLETYNLYLRGRYFWNKMTVQDMNRAVEYFDRALEKMPTYALAYAGLADIYTSLPFLAPHRPSETAPRAREAAARALEIDGTLAEAHTSLAYIEAVYDWEWAEAEKKYKRAIELNPGYATAHYLYGFCLMFMDRLDEAVETMKTALSLDPFSQAINRDMGQIFQYARRHDEAIEALQRTIEMDPNVIYAHALLGAAYMRKSMYEEALAAFEKELVISGGLNPAAEAGVATLYAFMGEMDKAQRIVDDLTDRSEKEYVTQFWLACAHFALGNIDEGFQCLNLAYEEHDHWLCLLKVSPVFDFANLRSDPRYIELLKKIGLDT